jgi:hypothetical protein
MSFTRIARREKAISRAVADDTLGASGAAVKPCKSVVTGNRPYIPCMSPVKSVCVPPFIQMELVPFVCESDGFVFRFVLRWFNFSYVNDYGNVCQQTSYDARSSGQNWQILK